MTLFRSILIIVLFVASPSFAGDKAENRFVLTPVIGDVLSIAPPGNPAGGGVQGALSTLKQDRPVGNFRTDIISGEDIFWALSQLTSPGDFVDLAAVNGEFNTRFGSINETHRPTVILLSQAPSFFEQGIVMVAIGEGVISGGTRRFRRAEGTSSLYLKFEVNPATFEAVVVAGSFLFDLN